MAKGYADALHASSQFLLTEPLLDLLEDLQRLDLRPDIGKPDIRR